MKHTANKVKDIYTVIKKQYATSNPLPKLPSTDFKSLPYKGPSYEKAQSMQLDNVFPQRQMYDEPLLLYEGKMQWLFDHKGKRYLDMFGGIATVSVGHCHPRVTEAIVKQSGILGHVSGVYEHPKMYEYVEMLVSKMPGNLKAVYLVNSGSEANELAMQLARLHSGNQDVLSVQNCYHGVTGNLHGLTALSSTRYNNLPAGHSVHHVMCPDVFKGIWGGKKCRDSPVQTQRSCDCGRDRCQAADKYYEQIEEVFSYSIPRGKVAAFFAESIQGLDGHISAATEHKHRPLMFVRKPTSIGSIDRMLQLRCSNNGRTHLRVFVLHYYVLHYAENAQGVGGVVQFPRDYLKKVYELIRSNGGLCVADEVQTGFGRTGEHFWNFQSHGVMPDIVTMAKGIGNGFPMAAVVTTPEIAKSLNSGFHFNTFGGNPIACAVGSSVLKVIEEEGLQQNSMDVGTYFLDKLSGMRREWNIIGDVRGKGLMIGVELVDSEQNESDKKGQVHPLNARAISCIKNDCLKMGLLIGIGGVRSNVIRFMPPMCVTKDDVDFTISVLRRAMQNYYEAKYHNNL